MADLLEWVGHADYPSKDRAEGGASPDELREMSRAPRTPSGSRALGDR